jgi:hypothetical protein
MPLSFQQIAPFLDTRKNRFSQWLSYGGLAIGVLLLLCSLQMYININQLLRDKQNRKNGYDFISVTKRITNKNMGRDNRFQLPEVEALRQQPFIEDAAPLLANQFRVKASAGNIIPFSTDLFLEALNEQFIDTVPTSFHWKPGDIEVPIIFSSDFMEMYNVFAPSQDLPQLSDETMSAVNIILECHTPNGVIPFRSRIVALSDRINSVLVPEPFLVWANKNFAGVTQVPATRVYLKTKDANSADLLNYLEQQQYRVNKDKTKFGRVKQVLQAIISGMAGFGVLVILLAMVLFSFYLQLMVAKSQANLELLLTLGYGPSWLSKTVARKWIPVYTGIVLFALVVTNLVQIGFRSLFLLDQDQLSLTIHWSVAVVAAVLWLLAITINFRLIRNLLHKLG